VGVCTGQFDCSPYRGGQRCFRRRCFCGHQRSAGVPALALERHAHAQTGAERSCNACSNVQARTLNRSCCSAAAPCANAHTLAPFLPCGVMAVKPGVSPSRPGHRILTFSPAPAKNLSPLRKVHAPDCLAGKAEEVHAHAQTLTRSRAPTRAVTHSARLRWPGHAQQVTLGNAAAAAGGLSW